MAITSSLEGGSSIQEQLGMGHVVAGRVTGSAGTDAVLTCNDRSAVLTRSATGAFTVTFGEVFNAAPALAITPVLATFTTLTALTAQIKSNATNAFSVDMVLNTTNVTVTALSDADFHFVAIGKRNV